MPRSKERKRKGCDHSAAAQPSLSVAIGGDTGRALARTCNKTELLTTLHTLENAGLLTRTTTKNKLRRTMQRVVVQHANASTPYGPVVQRIDLNIPSIDSNWEYVHPCAYLYYISTLIDAFGDVMRSCFRPGEAMRIVLYMDELCPGNPFRTDKARKLQAVYWCCLQWPAWLLNRSIIWPILGIIRSKVLDKLSGGISAFMAKVLELLFLDTPQSLRRGLQIVWKDERIPLRGEYNGFMADEDCLKKVHDYKGAQGLKCCMDCSNLLNTANEASCPPGTVPLHAFNLANIDRNSDYDIWEMADVLQERAHAGSAYAHLQKAYGLKYNPRGLLYNVRLRDVHRPTKHYIRDWMHIIVSGGVANTHMACLNTELRSHGLPTNVLQRFSMECVLPRQYGKVCESWTDAKRWSDFDFSSFASTILSLVPIVCAFLIDYIRPRHIVDRHIECFQLLANIIGLLSSKFAVQHLDLLEELINRHHELFVELYPPQAVKPKWHHMLHLPEQYRRLGKIISCFVTERKHKIVKRAASHVFRHLEHTVLADILNQQCEAMRGDDSLFKRQFLINAHTVEISGSEFIRSSQARLECGRIYTGDIVYVIGGVVARVMHFWKSPSAEHIAMQCAIFENVDEYIYRDGNQTSFVSVDSIVDAVTYRPLTDGSIRVMLPFDARFY